MNADASRPSVREGASPPPGCSPEGAETEPAEREAGGCPPAAGTPPDHPRPGGGQEEETPAGHGPAAPGGPGEAESPPHTLSVGGEEEGTAADAASPSPAAGGGGGKDEMAQEELAQLLGGETEPSAAPPPRPHRDEDITADGWRAHRKHVFVLSEAGKPIYSRYGNEEALSSTMGVMMALVSFVQAGDNLIRSIQADDYKVVFSQQGPLVLVSVSRSRQSERQLRRELLYVYYQILSMLTQASLTRIFQRKQSYDLRRLLAGSEKILDSLLRRLDGDPGALLGAVQCLPLPPALRDAASQLLQRAVTPNLVFSILVGGGKLVAIVQEKAVIEDSRLDPVDVHLLFNLLAASASFQAGEVWAPVCLPRLYPDGFFYAYVSYLDPACRLCLLLISTDKTAFYSVAACKRRIEEGLRSQGLLRALEAALSPGAGGSPSPSPSPSQLCIADLWHFMYKPLDVPENHKQLTQYASPEMKAPYCTEAERQRLFDLYQYLHGRVHSYSRPLRLIYHVAEKETLLAWVTGKFELYACFSPLVTKASAIHMLTQLLRWLKREEETLFICTPPKYCTTPSPGRRTKAELPSPDNGLLSLL